ncbi:membrane protein [Microbacterium phage Cece]|nr:membrane protein [Microbacterium phage Cece]
MGLVWFVIGLIVIAVVAMGFVLYQQNKRQAATAGRNAAFRVAIMNAEADYERALLVNGSNVPSPDMRIAEKKIIRYKEQYAAGKELPE